MEQRRRPCEDKVRGWNEAVTSQREPAATRSSKRQGKILFWSLQRAHGPRWILETLAGILKAITWQSMLCDSYIQSIGLEKTEKKLQWGGIIFLDHQSWGVRRQDPKLLWGSNKLTVIISKSTSVGTVESKSRMLTMAPRLPGDELTSCATLSVLLERSFRYVGSFLSWEGLLIKA